MGLIVKLRLAVAGKKTIITAVVLALMQVLDVFGIHLEPEVQKAIEDVLMGLLIIFLRLGIAKAEKKGETS